MLGTLLLALTLLTPTAQESLDGTWEGTLASGGRDIRMVLHLSTTGETLGGAIDSPEQNAFGLAIADVVHDGDELSFRVPSTHGAWQGRIDQTSGRLVGTWKQRLSELELVLERVDVDPLVGTWEGLADFGSIQLRIVFHVGPREDGSLGASMVSPDQASGHIPTSAVVRDGDAVRIEIDAAAAKYEGVLAPDGARIEGHFSQAGARIALDLERAGAAPEASRPQTPLPPFPYRSVDVTYDNAAGGNRLAGTLTLPEGNGPFPAVLLITGSGQQDRNEELFGHKPFLVIADDLTRRGIAVLRVDDRRVGGSTGDVSNATSEDFATDVSAGIDFLLTRDDIRADRIGLLGHSEGGMIAPLVARSRDDVAFLVLLAGPGITGERILILQAELIARAGGAPEEAIATNRELQQGLFQALREEDDAGALRERIRRMLDELGVPDASAQVAQFATPWFQYFVRYDPVPVLREVHCPVLAVNGGLDLQVPPKENLAGIARALEEGGNTDFETREFAGLNHLFQHCESGAPTEYGKIEETFAPEVLDAVGRWIVARIGADE